jgi:hypothetical protein
MSTSQSAPRISKAVLRAIATIFISMSVLSWFLASVARPAQARNGYVKSPLWPSQNQTFNYNGKDYKIYNVPTSQGIRQLALVELGRAESKFIDPANPGAGQISWQGNGFALKPVWIPTRLSIGLAIGNVVLLILMFLYTLFEQKILTLAEQAKENRNRKLAARISLIWTGNWSGISFYTEKAHHPEAGAKLAQALRQEADKLDVPIIISLGKPSPIGVDQRTRKVTLWGVSVGVILPNVGDSYLGPSLAKTFSLPIEFRRATVRHQDFATIDEAADWCSPYSRNKTWHCHINRKPTTAQAAELLREP